MSSISKQRKPSVDLVAIDEGLNINPQYVVLVAKEGKMGHPLDQLNKDGRPTVLIQMITGMMIQTRVPYEDVMEKLGDSFHI